MRDFSADISCPVCGAGATRAIFQPVYTPKTTPWRERALTAGDARAAAGLAQGFRHCGECGFVFRPEDPDFVQAPGATRPIDDPARLAREFEAHRVDRSRPDMLAIYEWIGATITIERLLDVGCEFGHLQKYFADRGCHTVGIDPNPGPVSIGRERLSLDLRLGWYDEGSFPSGSFDFISAECVAYYFRPSLPAFLAIARRHLTPGGGLYLQIGGVEKLGDNFLPNYVRWLIPYENAESVFSHAGWTVLSKNKDHYRNGSYGVILRAEVTAPEKPVLDFAAIRRHLLCSDYNFLPFLRGPIPAPLQCLMTALHRINPGGPLPGFYARALNRLTRAIGIR